jgi:hypothetical protein
MIISLTYSNPFLVKFLKYLYLELKKVSNVKADVEYTRKTLGLIIHPNSNHTVTKLK